MKTKIKLYRISAGLTQKEFSVLLGYKSASAIAMWESGDRKPPVDKLPKIAKILGCTIDDLFKDE